MIHQWIFFLVRSTHLGKICWYKKITPYSTNPQGFSLQKKKHSDSIHLGILNNKAGCWIHSHTLLLESRKAKALQLYHGWTNEPRD